MRLLTPKWSGAIVVGLMATAAAAVPATASAAASPVDGHVYVDDNTTGTNTIAAFDRHPDGTLTPQPGSPFVAEGAGTGTGLASQGAVQVSSDGRYLLAVDAGSSQVSVLRIKPDGGLKLVPGGVVSSVGVEPVSIAEHDGLVYVANAGNGGSNYAGFTLNPGGHLRPLPRSTVSLPDGSQPGDVLFNSTGTNLVGTRIGTSLIDSFGVGQDGRLTPAAGSPFAAGAAGPFGSEFRPTDPSQLFVSNAHGGPGNGSVSAFSVAAAGTLSVIGASPFPDLQTAPCWVEITQDGKFLFTTNTASGTVSRYSIARDGALTLLGSTPTGAGPLDARLSTDGRTLYTLDGAINAISGFAVSGGTLTSLGAPLALPAGAAPAGVAVN
jgi:6-phosphogluconolactonase (cycloisomerase 2 family)